MKQNLDTIIDTIYRICEAYLSAEGPSVTASDTIIEIYGEIKHITMETLAKPEWSAKEILRKEG